VRSKDGEAIAVKTRSEGGKETEWYLVGTPGSTYEWVLGDIVSMLPAALPTPNGPPDDAPPGATAG
jgi:hypothetical protein